MTDVTTAEDRADLKQASTGELVRRLSEQLAELLRGEMELARAELRRKGKRVGAGAGLAGAAAVLALFGLAALITAAIAGLALVVPVWLSAVIVGGGLLVLAGVLALAGRGQIAQGTPPIPEQAVRGIKQDVQAVKEGVRR